MTTETQTFKEPWLTKVKEAVDSAVSITWEGCHKIYICLDQESHEQQIAYGHQVIPVKDKSEALNQLYEWFDVSCGLRFINAIEGGGTTFHDVIPQCDYEEEENEL